MSSEFDSLYRKHYPMVMRKCRRVLGSEADAADVTQETLVRFWQARLEHLGARQTIAWLYKTCTNLCIDRLRRRRATIGEDAAERLGVDVRTEITLSAPSWVARLSDSVSPEELSVAVMARVDEMPQKEIAEVMGVTERTVRRWLTAFDERVTALKREVLS